LTDRGNWVIGVAGSRIDAGQPVSVGADGKVYPSTIASDSANAPASAGDRPIQYDMCLPCLDKAHPEHRFCPLCGREKRAIATTKLIGVPADKVKVHTYVGASPGKMRRVFQGGDDVCLALDEHTVAELSKPGLSDAVIAILDASLDTARAALEYETGRETVDEDHARYLWRRIDELTTKRAIYAGLRMGTTSPEFIEACRELARDANQAASQMHVALRPFVRAITRAVSNIARAFAKFAENHMRGAISRWHWLTVRAGVPCKRADSPEIAFGGCKRVRLLRHHRRAAEGNLARMATPKRERGPPVRV
jgi:hypothetical protein